MMQEGHKQVCICTQCLVIVLKTLTTGTQKTFEILSCHRLAQSFLWMIVRALITVLCLKAGENQTCVKRQQLFKNKQHKT